MSKNKSKTPPPAAASLSSFYFSSAPKEEPKEESVEHNGPEESKEAPAEHTESLETEHAETEPVENEPAKTRQSQEQSLTTNANRTIEKQQESPAIEVAQQPPEIQQDSDKEYRTESISLIVTRSLYDDLKILTKLNNKKNSTNDLIIDILTEYTNKASNQEKIKLFREIFPTIGN